MSDDEHDDLTGIFDNLTPEDFLEPLKKGVVAFDAFVKEQIKGVRMAWLAAEGNINSVAIFADPSNEWTFTPTEDENLGEYVERLREAGKTLNATWFFISRKTQVGAIALDTKDIKSADDPDLVNSMTEIMGEGIFYYAERLEDGVRDVRLGMMRADGNELGRVVEGNAQVQGVGIFHHILS